VLLFDRNIKEGLYALPFDMEPRHRQFNPLFTLQQSLRFFEEATGTLKRKAENASTEVWMHDTNLYPSYYRCPSYNTKRKKKKKKR
jgi:hypothetical protein